MVDNRKAQKTLLGAFEILVGQEHPELLLPRVLLILKAFYDCDLLEEESILEWAEKVCGGGDWLCHQFQSMVYLRARNSSLEGAAKLKFAPLRSSWIPFHMVSFLAEVKFFSFWPKTMDYSKGF